MTHSDFARRWQRRFVERGARFDDDAGIAGWTETGLESRLRQFRRHWRRTGRTPHGVWIDIGCGAGTYCRWLHAQGAAVVGVDYAGPSLHKARARSPAGIGWVAGDLRRLPLPGEVADGLLCLGVTQALPESGAALAELHRVLRPGGELWIDGLNARCLPTAIAERRRRRAGGVPHLRYEDPEALQRAAEAAGLALVERLWLPLVPGRLAALQPALEAAPIFGVLHRLPRLGARLSHSFLLRLRRPAAPEGQRPARRSQAGPQRGDRPSPAAVDRCGDG